MMYRKTVISIIAGICLAATGGLRPDRADAQKLMTLDQALEIAMENSPVIKRSELNLVRSRELLEAQRAALKSRFNLSLNPISYSRDRQFDSFLSEWSTTETTESFGSFTISQPIAATDGTVRLTNRLSWQDSYSDYRDVRNETFLNSLYISFSQPLFTYNRTKLATRELELDLESVLLDYSIQKLNIELLVAQRFYTVYQNQLRLDIAVDEQENQEESYNIIKNKVDAGLVALEEQYQAELNLATSRSSVQNAEVTLQNSLDSFKALINVPLWEDIRVDVETDYAPVPVDLDKAVETGLARRMELRQNEISLINARNDLIRTEAQNEFLGNLDISLGIIGNDEDFMDLYNEPTDRQSIGISFEIPLWDWGEKESRIKATQASIERQEVTNEDEKTNITLEIRQSYRELNNLVNQIAIEEQNVRNAELTYEINLERYRNGDLTSMDLSLYQNQLSQRKLGYVQALINYRLALLDLKVKSLWDFENDEPVIPDMETVLESDTMLEQ